MPKYYCIDITHTLKILKIKTKNGINMNYKVINKWYKYYILKAKKIIKIMIRSQMQRRIQFWSREEFYEKIKIKKEKGNREEKKMRRKRKKKVQVVAVHQRLWACTHKREHASKYMEEKN